MHKKYLFLNTKNKRRFIYVIPKKYYCDNILKRNEKVYAVIVWKDYTDRSKKVLIICKTKSIADEVAKDWKNGIWENAKIIEIKVCKSSKEGNEGIEI